jgi:hypothetical protein
MMQRSKLAILVLALLFSAVASSKSLVRDFSGKKSTTTAIFTVDGPWLLDWRLDADYTQLTALHISLIEAGTGRHLGEVLRTQRRGNGVKLFAEGGSYQLRVSATLARWRIKIEQITPEEAKQYTPRAEN